MSMREMMARRLFEKEWPGSNPDRLSFGQPVWSIKLPHVDALLDALMELSDAVMAEILDATAGDPVSVSEGVLDTDKMFKVAHQAMIRAIKDGK